MKKWQRPKPCWCAGYWFPHRKGGGSCHFAPELTAQIAQAIREGRDVLQVLADYAYDNPGTASPPDSPCPF